MLTEQKLQNCIISELKSHLLSAKSSKDTKAENQQRINLLLNLNDDDFINIDQNIKRLIKLIK